jgi:hypothetical protein
VNRLESVSAAFDIIRIEDGKNRDDVSNCHNPLQTAFLGAKKRPNGRKTIPFARCDILSREGWLALGTILIKAEATEPAFSASAAACGGECPRSGRHA